MAGGAAARPGRCSRGTAGRVRGSTGGVHDRPAATTRMRSGGMMQPSFSHSGCQYVTRKVCPVCMCVDDGKGMPRAYRIADT